MRRGFPSYRNAVTSRRLHLVLLPTERCNLRCHYCYEDLRLSRMPPDVVRGVMRLLEARMPDLDRLDLSWFGGEPLLALVVVREIMAQVQHLGLQEPGVRIASDMTTNGDRLTPEVAAELLQLGINRYQITLDGVEVDHDAARKRPNGKGTFQRIWANLVALKSQPPPLSVLVRIHATRANAARLPELLEACADAFADDRRYSFLIRPLARLGGAKDAGIPVLEGDQGGETIARLRRRARALGLTGPPLPDPICYAAKANSWVIRANGDLNKCTVALADPRNRVGRLNPDGTLSLDPERLPLWLRGLSTGQAEDLGCPWKALRERRLANPPSKSAA